MRENDAKWPPLPAAISVSGPDSRVDAAFGERAVPLLRDAALRLGTLFSAPV
jgi:IclR family acetate operon transcriptional repressor